MWRIIIWSILQMSTNNIINVGVLGASGYIGAELLQRLEVHPNINLKFISSEQYAGKYPYHLFPQLRNFSAFKQRRFQKITELPEVDLVISALPSGVLPKIITQVLTKTNTIINIAGDFRLQNINEIKQHYPASLDVDENISRRYIVPDFEEDFSGTVLNMPGCMAGAIIYALYPLAKHKLLTSEVIVDAKTGSSGGGAKQAEAHASRANNVKTYKLLGHRHENEVQQYLSQFSSDLKRIYMTVTSLDVPRGILVHAHGNLKKTLSLQELHAIYREIYQNHDFNRIVVFPQVREGYPSIKAVVGTNACEIGFALSDDGQHFVMTTAIDNLVRGGAGNAIFAMNKRYGFGLTLGLQSFGMWP